VGRNLVLAVFGDVDARDVLLKVKKHFVEINCGDMPDISPSKEPKIKSVQTSFKALPKEQTLLLMGFPGTTVFARDRYILEIICRVLSQSSGRLFTQIREKAGLAYTLGAYSVLGLDPGYLVIYVATTSESIETVKEEILRHLRLLKQEPLSQEELEQAKRALMGQKLIGRQTNAACAMESSLDELYGLGYNHYLKYAQEINRIGADDVKRCASQYFGLSNYAVVVVGPDSTEKK
jgi:zinc protease